MPEALACHLPKKREKINLACTVFGLETHIPACCHIIIILKARQLVPTALPMLILTRYIAVLCVAAFAAHLERLLAAAGSFAAVGADQSRLRHACLCTESSMRNTTPSLFEAKITKSAVQKYMGFFLREIQPHRFLRQKSQNLRYKN